MPTKQPIMAKIKKFKVSVNPFTYTCIIKYKN